MNWMRMKWDSGAAPESHFVAFVCIWWKWQSAQVCWCTRTFICLSDMRSPLHGSWLWICSRFWRVIFARSSARQQIHALVAFQSRCNLQCAASATVVIAATKEAEWQQKIAGWLSWRLRIVLFPANAWFFFLRFSYFKPARGQLWSMTSCTMLSNQLISKEENRLRKTPCF